MIVSIKVMPRDVILDSEGRAVENSMRTNGFEKLSSCRIGKMIELELRLDDRSQAINEVEKMLKDGGLYNPLIEKYEILN